MSFDWQDYRRLAEHLAKTRNPDILREACDRAAISRSYYAAFNVARRFLEDKKHIIIPNVGAHLKVIDTFSNQGIPGHNPDYNEISNKLYNAKKFREAADYEKNTANIGAFVSTSLKLSQEIINLVKTLN